MKVILGGGFRTEHSQFWNPSRRPSYMQAAEKGVYLQNGAGHVTQHRKWVRMEVQKTSRVSCPADELVRESHTFEGWPTFERSMGVGHTCLRRTKSCHGICDNNMNYIHSLLWGM
ncbi:hypothetical protein CDAR_393441 [Caerostris darwini]|uniref:Uncharacterized protein n=1 Tax=Caerostris darwini TaxID=1538125 RepID=A0AAV4W6V6_9ARAC|nr:hypothetical protein CDAR_393441 [Caerostris darwini]